MRVLSDRLIRSGTILTFAAIFTSFINLAFHALIGRTLTIEEYGSFQTLIAVGNSVTAPVLCISLLLTKNISKLFSSERLDCIYPTFKFFNSWLMVASLIVLSVSFCFSEEISDILNVENSNSVKLLFIVLAIGNITSLMMATMQGLQQFSYSALYRVLHAASKIFICWSLLLFFHGTVIIILVAALLGELILLLGCVLKLRNFYFMPSLGSKPLVSKPELFLKTFFATVSLSIAMQIDIILVSLFYSPAETGIYSAASTLAKAAVFLSANYVSVMFPLVSGGKLTEKQKIKILVQVSFITCLCGSLAGLGFLIFGNYLAFIILGRFDNDVGVLASTISFSLVPLALLHAFEHYFIAHDSVFVAWLLALCAPLVISSVYIFQNSLFSIPIIIGVITALVVCICIITLGRKKLIQC
jgi:O-antigen/teichoic acid export membrane protein